MSLALYVGVAIGVHFFCMFMVGVKKDKEINNAR